MRNVLKSLEGGNEVMIVKMMLKLLLMAFLISPMRVPLAAIWLLGKVQDLKYTIQDRVYG